MKFKENKIMIHNAMVEIWFGVGHVVRWVKCAILRVKKATNPIMECEGT